MNNKIRVISADFEDARHCSAIVELIDEYARLPIASGKPLPAEVRSRMVAGLQAHPTARVYLASDGVEAVGVAVCFLGYSTFAACPLLNIHDLAVSARYRGQGVGSRLLAHVEEQARKLGCCKVTLEVREENASAEALYRRLGYGADGEPTRFLWKRLHSKDSKGPPCM